MILVDSSVWIDWFRNKRSAQVERLDQLARRRLVGIPDLVVTEVLQGCDTDAEFDQVRQTLAPFAICSVLLGVVPILAATNYRQLRSRGITIRSTIDTLIATRCIVDDLPLLFSDRDFQPFIKHLGLRDAMAEPL